MFWESIPTLSVAATVLNGFHRSSDDILKLNVTRISAKVTRDRPTELATFLNNECRVVHSDSNLAETDAHCILIIPIVVLDWARLWQRGCGVANRSGDRRCTCDSRVAVELACRRPLTVNMGWLKTANRSRL